MSQGLRIEDPRAPGYHIAPKLPPLARARHHATLKYLPGCDRRGRDSRTRRRRRSVVYQAFWDRPRLLEGGVPGILALGLSHSGSEAGNLAVSSAGLRSVCDLALSDVAWRRGAFC